MKYCTCFIAGLVFSFVAFSGYAANNDWTAPFDITDAQPLVEWNGGMIRIVPTTATNPANCPVGNIYDFTYDAGTQETRSAVVAAIYMSLAAGKKIRLYIDGISCSPAGAPIVRGANVLR